MRGRSPRLADAWRAFMLNITVAAESAASPERVLAPRGGPTSPGASSRRSGGTSRERAASALHEGAARDPRRGHGVRDGPRLVRLGTQPLRLVRGRPDPADDRLERASTRTCSSRAPPGSCACGRAKGAAAAARWR